MTGLGLIPTYAADSGYGDREGFYLIVTMNMYAPYITAHNEEPNKAHISLQWFSIWALFTIMVRRQTWKVQHASSYGYIYTRIDALYLVTVWPQFIGGTLHVRPLIRFWYRKFCLLIDGMRGTDM